MKIDCCMITTNLQNRLSLVENTVNSLTKLEDRFSRKIMSVDVFPDGASMDWFERFQESGWTVLSKKVDPKKSMILNQRNVITNATSDVILYTEDDILINNLPKLTTIQKLFNEKIIDGKRVGFICFNNHVFIKFNENPKHITDFINDLGNYITIDGDVFLIKNETLKDRYYLNFPVAITTKKLFLELQDYALARGAGLGVEAAMTGAWFDTGKKMNDGTPRTVCAYDEAQREEYLKRGWKPVPEGFYQGQVEEKEETIIPGSPKRKKK